MAFILSSWKKLTIQISPEQFLNYGLFVEINIVAKNVHRKFMRADRDIGSMTSRINVRNPYRLIYHL